MVMAPVIPYSISNTTLIPGTTLILGRNNLTRCNFRGNSTRLCTQSFFLPLSTTPGLFPKNRRWSSPQRGSRIHIVRATGTELAVEEPGSTVAGEDAVESVEVPESSVETSEASSSTADANVTPTAKSKSPRPIRKSDVPPVKNEELVPGATFTGKVRSVQPFGAFVDFGAFTDGLVHISNLSDSFVEDVSKIVSVGQEVKVRLLEANAETKRISLTMREGSDFDQRKDPGKSDGKPRPARKNTQQRNVKSSKFVKGQELQGTVKNTIRAGTFISLPEGEEGFLPTSEELDDGLGEMMGGSSLQVGQEVTVRVLRISKGQVTLTMKKEEDIEANPKPIQGVVHTATNPFLLAFRKNKDIATFLDEREDKLKLTEASKLSEKTEEITETKSDVSTVQDQSPSTDEDQVGAHSVVDDVLVNDTPSEEVNKEIEAAADVVDDPLVNATPSEEVNKEVEATTDVVDASPSELLNDEENSENAVSDLSQSADTTDESAQEEELSSKASTPVENVSSVNSVTEKAQVADPVKEDGNESEAAKEIGGDKISSSETESQADESMVKDEAPEQQKEVLSATQKEDVSEKNGSATTSSADAPSPQETAPKASISPALVKKLREDTGAGMMDCKKALAETGGDIVQAQEFLRKKGLASADKKASRATAEGRIGSYIHDSRIGVLLEVNCETDFVARGDIFKELVDDLAMQVAACPQVQYLVTDDIPEEFVNKEREIEMQKEDLQSKPEQFRSKIVEGRIRKRLEELALLEQPYIKNDKVVVKDFVKQTIATIGENIKVKKFVRYNLGEGLEKKSQDFAAEVAAQTAAKSSPAPPPTNQPAPVEAEETVKKPPAVAISAALVKQLREETGAGMMDCKKALAETGGDLEKAQEYLRKKGLSTADKKSSRLAAEGRIGSYIHDSRIGVLIEVNCETDFVGRSEKFKETVDDLAMQVVACPQVQYVSIEDIPEAVVSKERELEMQREDLLSKPENIREKIVEGRISKRLGELALLEQPFIKDDSVLVKDLIKQTVAALGENIKVRRFVRFTLGEVVEDVKEATDA